MKSGRLSIMGAVGATTILAGGAAAGIDRDPEVAALIARAGEAHDRLMRGDIARYREAIQLAPDFTLMDPFGGAATPVPASEAHWQRIGRFFREGKTARFEPVAAYRSDSMVVLVANEHADVAVGSLPSQPWSLRVTLVFRRDQGGWRLIHRHADPLASGIRVQDAARLARGG